MLRHTSTWASWGRTKPEKKLVNPQVDSHLLNSKAVYEAQRGQKPLLLLTPGCPWSLWQTLWSLIVALGCRGEIRPCIVTSLRLVYFLRWWKTCTTNYNLLIRHMNDSSENWQWLMWFQIIHSVTLLAIAVASCKWWLCCWHISSPFWGLLCQFLKAPPRPNIKMQSRFSHPRFV